MQSLTKIIHSAYIESTRWKDEVHNLLLSYRTTPHSNKGLAPTDIMLKRKIRGNLTRCQCHVNPNIDTTLAAYKNKTGSSIIKINPRSAANLKGGDQVLVKQHRVNKLRP